MGRISRADSKPHEQAEVLLRQPELTPDDVEFVYQHWTPLAQHNVGSSGIFFTPPELAHELHTWAMDGGRILDLAAGIGILSWSLLQSYRPQDYQIVALELSEAFCQVGRKLLPQVQWVCGSIFDVDLLRTLGKFDQVIANPPFGKLPSTQGRDWLRTAKLPAHLAAVEVAMCLADSALMILPSNDLPFTDNGGSHKDRDQHPLTTNYKTFAKLLPEVEFYATTIDCSQFAWDGTSPRVDLVRIEPADGADGRLPLALPEPIGKQVSLL
jgi:phospholipid N-methyltransferase